MINVPETTMSLEYFGPCEGGHSVVVESDHPQTREEVIAFTERATGLKGRWEPRVENRETRGKFVWILIRA